MPLSTLYRKFLFTLHSSSHHQSIYVLTYTLRDDEQVNTAYNSTGISHFR